MDRELRVFHPDLYSTCVCNLRVADWRSEPSIDYSEDVIEAVVMGFRTWRLSLWNAQLSYTGSNQSTSSSHLFHAEMHQALGFKITPLPEIRFHWSSFFSKIAKTGWMLVLLGVRPDIWNTLVLSARSKLKQTKGQLTCFRVYRTIGGLHCWGPHLFQLNCL